jgi:hypothetical protein
MVDLAGLIALEHATWDHPVVDALVFGTTAPAAIAAQIDAFCRASLASPITHARFYRVSVGCVAGVDLEDGRSVVVKAHPGTRSERFHAACHTVRRYLVERGFPCPMPLADPTRQGEAWFTAEALMEVGEKRDAHEAPVRRATAATLARLVELARPLATLPGLGPAWFTGVPPDRIFPRPHSPLFDFDATAAGAEWIDALAARARARGAPPAGDVVVGHFDWRAEHLRFDGDRVVASYDWDSLHAEREPVLVGAVAHAFTADWQRDDLAQAPTLEELRQFVDDYEAARGRRFDPAERRTLWASCVYSLAYTARCNHALRVGPEGGLGDFRPLLRDHGDTLLA